MSEKKFPIIGTGEYTDWNLIEPHRDQAKHNHGQSLEQLADRGGLFWNELLWVLLDKGLWGIKLDSDEDYEKACRRALAHEELKQYRETGTPEECRAAMEKQEPFKPETVGLYIGIGRCKCGVEFLDSKTNYCGNCGQKLNWSTETVTEQEDMEARK